jgi:hypothetical protein
VNVDSIKVVWDAGEDSEENVFGKRKPETTFSFPVEPPRTLDNEFDTGVVESTGMQAVAGVIGT